MGLMSNQPSPFANFKIVKFLKSDFGRVYLEVEANEKATTSLVVDSSDQCSIFRMVSREVCNTQVYILGLYSCCICIIKGIYICWKFMMTMTMQNTAGD